MASDNTKQQETRMSKNADEKRKKIEESKAKLRRMANEAEGHFSSDEDIKDNGGSNPK